MRVAVLVVLDAPPETTPEDAVAYVRRAVKGYVGGLEPDDPFFELNRDSVTAVAVPMADSFDTLLP